MSKEVVQKLTKYQDSVKARLETKDLSDKQKNRPRQYREFLEKELKTVTTKIESLKMVGGK